MSKTIVDFLVDVKEEKLSHQVRILFQAMKDLSSHPEKIVDVNSLDNSIIERNYVCSLIYQLGKMQDDSFFPFSDNVLIGGDLNKFIDANREEIKSTCKNLDFHVENDSFIVIPDLIIHGSHSRDSINGKEQFVSVEVKCSDYLGIVPFERDFFKLNTYLTCLNYNNAIYIIVNTTKNRINQRIEQYIKNQYFVISERLNDLYFFIQENIKEEPKIYKIDYEKYTTYLNNDVG